MEGRMLALFLDRFHIFLLVQKKKNSKQTLKTYIRASKQIPYPILQTFVEFWEARKVKWNRWMEKVGPKGP